MLAISIAVAVMGWGEQAEARPKLQQLPSAAEVNQTKANIRELEKYRPGYVLNERGKARLKQERARLKKQQHTLRTATRGSTRPEALRNNRKNSGFRAPPRVSAPSSAPKKPEGPVNLRLESTMDLSKTWGFSPSRSKGDSEPRYVDNDSGKSQRKANAEGVYQGVTIASDTKPPVATPKRKKAGAQLTWTGFERGAHGGRVFFQLEGDIDYQVEPGRDRIQIKMPRTRVVTANNLRHLDLRFFETPAQKVYMTSKGGVTTATIELRAEADAKVRVERRADGYSLLIVDFGEGATKDIRAEVIQPKAVSAAAVRVAP